jgi:hypothetical protein
VLNPLATLFAQASFWADRICMSPPLSVTMRLTWGKHHGSFRILKWQHVAILA